MRRERDKRETNVRQERREWGESETRTTRAMRQDQIWATRLVMAEEDDAYGQFEVKHEARRGEKEWFYLSLVRSYGRGSKPAMLPVSILNSCVAKKKRGDVSTEK